MKFSVLLFFLMLTVWTAVSLVQSRHDNRKLFVQSQSLEKQRNAMNEEWGRLQLEQATWATHNRIEEVAREKLEMELPQTEQIKLVNQ